MSEINSNNLRPDLLTIADLIQPGEKVLDLGCGDGILLRHLIDTHQITGRGIELSESGVLACVRKGLSVRQGDLDEGLGDYPDHSFDTIVLSQTLPYLDDPSFILCEMLRVGRRAIVSLANWGHWHCRLNFLLTGRSPLVPGLPQPWFVSPRARPLTIRDFADFCEKQKIQISREVYLGETFRPLELAAVAKNWRAAIAIFELR